MKTKPVLSLDDAQRIGRAAMDHAAAHQWAVTVAVVVMAAVSPKKEL